MRYAISIPNFGDWADPRTIVSLAHDAETSGWNGFFLWDHIRFSAAPVPVQDPWVLLAAIATSTERLVIGPMVTPLPRRRPWVVARQAGASDHLSNGRMLLGVGLGEPRDVELGAFGEPTDLKCSPPGSTRAWQSSTAFGAGRSSASPASTTSWRR